VDGVVRDLGGREVSGVLVARTRAEGRLLLLRKMEAAGCDG
jgi:hypothetical protein